MEDVDVITAFGFSDSAAPAQTSAVPAQASSLKEPARHAAANAAADDIPSADLSAAAPVAAAAATVPLASQVQHEIFVKTMVLNMRLSFVPHPKAQYLLGAKKFGESLEERPFCR